MKRILSMLLAAMMVLSLAACGAKNEAPAEEDTPPAQEEEAATGTHIVVDYKGDETEVPDQIDRVVILGPLPAATVYSVFMGGDISKLVGVTPDLKNGVEYSVFAKYCPDIMNVASDFYAGGQLNMEELLKLEPDVVFYHSESDAEPICQAGIPAVSLTHPNKGGDSSPLETLRSWMDTFAQTFQMTSPAQDIIAYGEEVEAEIRSRIAENPTETVEKYLYINTYNDSGLVVAGAKSFAAWWTDLLGAENLGARATNSSVNMEQIYEWDPDKIFILTFSDKTPEDIYSNTVGEDDWSGVTAVKNQQVFKYPFGMHRWWPPCTDTPLAMWWSAKTAYPSISQEVEIIHEKEIEKLQAEKEKFERQLAQEQHKIQRLENRAAYYEKGDRRKRAHRLITRGAAIESVAPQTKDLSETAFYAFAEQIFALPDTQRLLAEAVSRHAGGD